MGIITKTASNIKKLFVGGYGGQSFLNYIYGGLTQYSRRKLLDQYKNLVYQCISVIAEDVALYQPIFFKKNTKGEENEINHEFEELIENPNPNQTKYELLEATQSYIELSGEAFWYFEVEEKSRKPRSIDLIRPDRVSVVIDKKDGSVIGYTVRRDDGIEIPLEKDEVLHFKMFNPVNPYHGLGTLQANLLYTETEDSTSEFQYNFMKNQATPSGVLSMKGNISVGAFNKVKKQWREQQAGIKNVGKTLFVRKGEVSFQKIGLSIADLDMKDLKDITEKRVRGAFRVPKALLGDTDSTGLGRNNIDAIYYIFTKKNIDPKQIRIDKTIQTFVRKTYKDDKIFVKHVSQIPEDEKQQLEEDTKAVGKWKTINEIRKQRGLEPVNGGDELYYSFNQIPVSASNPKIDESGSSSQAGLKIKIHRKKKVQKQTPEETFFNFLDRLEDTSYSRYRRILRKELKKQQADVIEKLQASQGGKSLKKAYEEIMPDENEEAIKWALLIFPLIINSKLAAGKAAMKFIGVSDIEFVLTQGQRDAIFNSTERLLKSFNRQTVLKLQKQLAAGVVDNESVAQLTKRVESVYSEARGFRASRIADTESHRAINESVANAYKQAGIKKIEWRAEPDACEYCASLDGSVVEIDVSFVPQGGTITGTEGGEYINEYDDIKYADAHPNCRCKLVPVIEKKVVWFFYKKFCNISSRNLKHDKINNRKSSGQIQNRR